jgi:hypothetical protein
VSERNATKTTRENSEGTVRVAFDLTPAMAEEVERILAVTDLGSKPEVFRRAFTLLRIHVDAELRGREIYMVEPGRPNERYIVTLPFTVKRDAPVSER